LSEEEGWVTGPALDTVAALKAVQVGDQVRLGSDLGLEYISLNCNGHVAVIETTDFASTHHRQWIYVAICQCGRRWSLPNRVITAWKPKKGVG
jgi:hypothetical protein